MLRQDEVYKIQMGEQEKDILRMIEIESNYLQQLQSLSNENEELRKENERLKKQ